MNYEIPPRIRIEAELRGRDNEAFGNKGGREEEKAVSAGSLINQEGNVTSK